MLINNEFGIPTKTDKTQESYLKRARLLVLACRKDLKLKTHEKLDYRRMVGWLSNKRYGWTKRTWRQYKASIAYFLGLEINKGDWIAQEAHEELMKISSEQCMKKSNKTSGPKQKKLSGNDLKKIRNALSNSNSMWAGDIERWIEAGLLTGLRPVEWEHAQIIQENNLTKLIVGNAKATNGRAHGEYRTLILNGLSSDEIKTIEKHIQRAEEWSRAGQYAKFYLSCSTALNRIVKKIWPKNNKKISLYTLRHQFSANAKASGFTRVEIAAMMGHAVDDTATIHYGRKNAGSDLIRVIPEPSEVLRIKQVYKEFRREPHPIVKQNISSNPSD